MKNFLTLTFFALASTSVFATKIQPPRFYGVEFEIVDIKPMCPRSLPTGAVCMGMGSIVTVETTLHGCLDDLEFFKFEQTRLNNGQNIIYAIGVAKEDPKSILARCMRANTVRKTVFIQSPGNVLISNLSVE